MIFCRATYSEACCIKSCLDKYCKWSDQSINSSKSSIRFSRNTNPVSSLSISNILPYQTNSSKSSIYLCLPILFGNSKLEAFHYILDKIHKKIDRWRAKTLSQAGRLVLIKTVAAAMPTYVISSFLLLVSFYNNLDRMFKDLWWGFPLEKSKNLTLKSWDSMCLSKALGGLGLRRMKDVNMALIAKLGWNSTPIRTTCGYLSCEVSISKLVLFSPPFPFIFLLALERSS